MKHLTETQLNEYLEAALRPAARRQIAAHLRGCDSCRSRLDALRRVFAELAALPEIRLSRDLSGPVLARLPHRIPRAWTPAFAAQAGAALGGCIWLAAAAVRAIPRIDLLWQWPDLPRIAVPAIQFSLPALRFSWPALPLIDPGQAALSTFNLALLIASAAALWVVGNAALLGGRLGRRS